MPLENHNQNLSDGVRMRKPYPMMELWKYRGFMVGTVKREFQLRYRNSILGAAWAIINPLAMIIVYTVIFSQVMRARLPGVDGAFAYSIFLMAGLLPWGLFSDLVSRGPNLFLDHANLLKKIHFPKSALLLIALCNGFINFAIIYSLFIGFLIVTGQFPGIVFLGVLPLLLLQIFVARGLMLILGVLNVFFRDVTPLTNIALQFGFWLTPILYSEKMIPPAYHIYLHLNPLSALFKAYQDIFIDCAWPAWGSLLPLLFCAVFLNWFGGFLFATRSEEMVDEL